MLNDASSVEQKIDYMRRCHKGGIEALCLHCRHGNLIPYGSSEWYRMIRSLVKEGDRIGMDIWLYDEDPFPSGAAGGMVTSERPELEATKAVFHQKPDPLQPEELWFIGEYPVMWAGLVPRSKDKQPVEMTDEVGVVRTDWFMGRWDSRYYYEEPDPFPCPRGAAVRPRYAVRVPKIPENHRLVAVTREPASQEGPWDALPDLLNPDSFDLFRKLTLDPYVEHVGEYFGSTIPGIFTDEAKPHGRYPITDKLFDLFAKEYGYDLRSRMYQLFGKAISDEYIRTRIDYREWVTQRFRNAFIEPYRQWCDAHDLQLVGHISPEDDPIAEAVTVGSVMPLMKRLSLPGTDVIVPFLGDDKAAGLNLGSVRASSIKYQQGRPVAISESLALSGWDVTSEKVRQILTWQKVLGIDRFFVHGFFMSQEGVVNYEAPPDYGPKSAIFPGVCRVNDWMKELGRVLDNAASPAQVAILNVMMPFWQIGEGGQAKTVEKMRRSMWDILLLCLEHHANPELIDLEDLEPGASAAGFIGAGEREYSRVLIPFCDIFPIAALENLQTAVQDGAEVDWFGGGPNRLRTANRDFAEVTELPGKVIDRIAPDDAWCDKNLVPVVRVEGENANKCYVRRFSATGDEGDMFLASNVSDDELSLDLPSENGVSWEPVEADGAYEVSGAGTSWRVPPQGAGLFRLRTTAVTVRPAPPVERRAVSSDRRFERVDPNILRLCAFSVQLGDEASRQIDHPQPYWQLSSRYRCRRTWTTFLGELPLESDVEESKLTYRFEFGCEGEIPDPELVLDPRCARGKMHIFMNGEERTGELTFPVHDTVPRRIRLEGIQRARNEVEICFDVEDALEGLLSQLYLEGDFDVDIEGDVPVLKPPDSEISKDGWQDMGMPHYMGCGIYRWEEEMSADDLELDWILELDQVVDSGRLRVNDADMGCCAWRPWRWDLHGLKPGRNEFELIVSSTAGNKFELDRPNTPQGWIGGGELVGIR